MINRINLDFKFFHFILFHANFFSKKNSRGDKTRTCGLYVPNVARYQLRYTPNKNVGKSTLFSVCNNLCA